MRLEWFGAAIVAAATAAVASSAQRPGAPQKPLVFESGVSLVAVPVFVTDKNGKSISGLTAADFEVEESGKPVPIAGFEAIDLDLASSPESQARFADLPLAVQAAGRRQFVLVLNSGFMTLAESKNVAQRMRTAAASFLRNTLVPGDLVAVVTMGGRDGLKVICGFTADHEAAALVVERKDQTRRADFDPLGLSGGTFALTNDRVGEELKEQEGAQAALEVAQLGHRSRGYIFDLEDLAKSLSPFRGRKQVVLMGNSFSESVFNDQIGFMERIFRQANNADVVFHTVSLRGIESAEALTERVTAARGNAPPADWSSLGSTGGRGAPAILNMASDRGTLAGISNNTGGRFIMPTGDFNVALNGVERISRQSYVIAFEAAGAAGTARRPLKIRVRRSGLIVSHRPTYVLDAPRKAEGLAATRAQAAEAINKGLSGGLLRVRVTNLPYRDPDGEPILFSTVRIDGPALSKLESASSLPVQVYGYAMRNGAIIDSIALETTLDLNRFGDAVRRSGFDVIVPMKTSPGEVDLRFFVRAGSDLTGSIRKTVPVPAPATGREPTLSKPMLTTSAVGRVIVPFQPAKGPHVGIPYHFGPDRFLPEVSQSLSTTETRMVCVFLWRPAEERRADLEVTGELIGAGGLSQPVRIAGKTMVAADADGFERHLTGIAAPGATPGAYTLRMTFTDRSSGWTRTTDAEVNVDN